MNFNFRAMTWNVNADVPAHRMVDTMKAAIAEGVSVALLNEAGSRDITVMLHELNWSTYCGKPSGAPGQWRVAWNPNVWKQVGPGRMVRLSRSRWFSRKTGKAECNYAALVLLRHRSSGKIVPFLSYHTPAHIQRPSYPAANLQVSREAFQSIAGLARKYKVLVSGGDDNVDEVKGFNRRWRYLSDKATGLRQVRAPRGTSGSRRIDDFRVKGVTPTGWARVWDGPSDHRAFLHGFEYQGH